MIESLQLRNLKSFLNTNEISLSYLTLFCGANSSGKSSILQALLLLSQTLNARQSSNSIVLNGHLARLGSFEDIKSHQSESDLIGLKLALRVNDPKLWYEGIESIELDLSFGIKRKSSSTEESLHPPIQSIKMKVSHGFGENRAEETIHVESANASYKTGIREHQFEYSISELATEDTEVLTKEYPGYEILGCTGSLLPNGVLVKYDHTKKIAIQVLAAVCGKSRWSILGGSVIENTEISLPSAFFLEINNRIAQERSELVATLERSPIFKELISFEKRKRGGIAKKKLQSDLLDTTFSLTEYTIDRKFTKKRLTPLSEWTEFLVTLNDHTRRALVEFIDKHRVDLQEIWYQAAPKEERVTNYQLRFFSTASQILRTEFPKSIKYLRPLRNEPSAVYPFMDQEIGTNVGLKGEYTAAVLHANKNRKIRYPKPVLSESQEFSWTPVSASLQDACHDWLSYLGVVKNVVTTDKGKLGYELQVRIADGERAQDLTHVGVGVSQVLPILVMCLLAEQDNILVLEQPELHLHPKVQSKLCDFFIAMAHFGRQCLVETHSEYLINRLRLRIAQGNQDRLEESSPIYFIEKNYGVSSIRKVEINRFGVVQEWPMDFFDQSDREVEAILVAAASRESKERKDQFAQPKFIRTRKDADSDQR